MNSFKINLVANGLGLFSAFLCSSVYAEIEPYYLTSQRDMGGVGLLQMPNARMAPKGEFSLNLNHVSPYNRFSIFVQPFDWLQGVYRYTAVLNQLYGPSIADDQSYKDKSADVKLRLWKESYYLPEIAVGLQDIGGTGLFDGEYLVASKRWRSIDFTLGIGWGYLGERAHFGNPLGLISDSMDVRPDGISNINDTGTVNWDSMFRGDIVLFGGVEYQTPLKGMRLKLEYDGNDYSDEFRSAVVGSSSPWNIGAVYRVSPSVDLHLGWERGDTLMAGVSFRYNFNTSRQTAKLDQKPQRLKHPSLKPKQLSQVDWPALGGALKDNAGYVDLELRGDGNDVILIASQNKFRDREEADERAFRVMLNYLPENVDKLFIEERKAHMPARQVSVDVAAAIAEFNNLDEPEKYEASYRNSAIEADGPYTTPLFSDRKDWEGGISPVLSQSIGGPDDFFLWQVGVGAYASYWLSDKWLASGGLLVALADNYDKYRYTAPSNLPRVRTYLREYAIGSDVKVGMAQLNYMDKFGSELYFQGYAGYLEQMFGGLGAEALYKPFGQNWAIAADLNWVAQRDFEGGFGFLDGEQQYDTVTGFVTGYWQPGWENIQVSASFGQFLAKDKGVQFKAEKTFSSGVRVGAYASFTDVSSEEYGEGSFTKGFYFSVPFDLFSIRHSTSRWVIDYQPLTRDGGQKLYRKLELHEYFRTD